MRPRIGWKGAGDGERTEPCAELEVKHCDGSVQLEIELAEAERKAAAEQAARQRALKAERERDVG